MLTFIQWLKTIDEDSGATTTGSTMSSDVATFRQPIGTVGTIQKKRIDKRGAKKNATLFANAPMSLRRDKKPPRIQPRRSFSGMRTSANKVTI